MRGQAGRQASRPRQAGRPTQAHSVLGRVCKRGSGSHSLTHACKQRAHRTRCALSVALAPRPPPAPTLPPCCLGAASTARTTTQAAAAGCSAAGGGRGAARGSALGAQRRERAGRVGGVGGCLLLPAHLQHNTPFGRLTLLPCWCQRPGSERQREGGRGGGREGRRARVWREGGVGGGVQLGVRLALTTRCRWGLTVCWQQQGVSAPAHASTARTHAPLTCAASLTRRATHAAHPPALHPRSHAATLAALSLPLPRAARSHAQLRWAALHTALCSGQCFFWQSRLRTKGGG